jgi:hypothetical protein
MIVDLRSDLPMDLPGDLPIDLWSFHMIDCIWLLTCP